MSRGKRGRGSKRFKLQHDLAWAQVELENENARRMAHKLPPITARQYAEALENREAAPVGNGVSPKALRLALMDLVA